MSSSALPATNKCCVACRACLPPPMPQTATSSATTSARCNSMPTFPVSRLLATPSGCRPQAKTPTWPPCAGSASLTTPLPPWVSAKTTPRSSSASPTWATTESPPALTLGQNRCGDWRWRRQGTLAWWRYPARSVWPWTASQMHNRASSCFCRFTRAVNHMTAWRFAKPT